MALWLSITALSASVLFSETDPSDRIYNHIFLQNYAQASKEAERYLASDPENIHVRSAYLRSLSNQGNVERAFKEWQLLEAKINDESTYRSLIESLAWGILSKHSNQLNVHMSSIVGAALTQDARALPILIQGLRSSNALIRVTSAQLTKSYRDTRIIDELLKQLTNERVWYVKLEILQALGQLRVEKAVPLLESIIRDDQSQIEERTAAMSALCSIQEDVTEEDIIRLVKSSRIGERHFAARAVLAFEKREMLQHIFPLMGDASPEVIVAGITTSVLLGSPSEELSNHLSSLVEHAHAEVAISAAWGLGIIGKRAGIERLKVFLLSPYAHIRQIAASALSFFAYEHEQELLNCIRDQADPFVRLNIAKGILCTGSKSRSAQNEVVSLLKGVRQRLMTITGLNPLFQVITASTVRHTFGMQQYPAYVDSVTRLDLINILAVRQNKEALAMVESFLTETQLGVSFSAALILIQEGVEESIELVHTLLQHENEMLRLQAAFILAFMGEEEKAFPILKSTYTQASRDVKVHILQAMGHIRSKDSIAFLLEVMQDPFLVLRVVSASSLIQCVYN